MTTTVVYSTVLSTYHLAYSNSVLLMVRGVKLTLFGTELAGDRSNSKQEPVGTGLIVANFTTVTDG